MVGMLRNRFVVSQGALLLMELMTFFFFQSTENQKFHQSDDVTSFPGLMRGPGSEGGVFSVVSFHFSASRLLVNRVQNWL